MTLREALEINNRINILPYSLAKQIRDLQLETIEGILKDPAEDLLYNKIEAFEQQIALLGDKSSGYLRSCYYTGVQIRRQNSFPGAKIRSDRPNLRRHFTGKFPCHSASGTK